MITAEEIEEMLRTAFPDAKLSVVDTTGTHDHFQAVIITEAFEGLSRVRRQQAVYAAIGDAMRTRIHALALVTQTPAEYQSRS